MGLGPLVFKYATDTKGVDDGLKSIDSAHTALAGKLAGTGAAIKGSLAPATSAFGLLKGSIAELTGGMGPLPSLMEGAGKGVDHLKEQWSEMGAASQKAGAVMVGAGAAITGAGAVLVEVGHAQETAQLGLEQAIKNTGGTFEDYKGKIDQVVKSNENHAVSMSQTDNALAQLTQAFNDPAKAADAMNHVLDLARSKHEDLATATTQYIQIASGKGTRTLIEFGISTQALTTLETQEATAKKAVTAATDAHQKALQKLTDLETVDHGKKTLSVADHIALRNAQDLVNSTATTLAAKTSLATTAQETLTKAQSAGGSAIDQLNAKTKGMADAMDSSLGAKFAAAKVKVEDFVGSMGNKFGPEMVKAGPLIMGVGAVLESGLIPKLVTTGLQFVGTGFLALKTFAAMAAGAIADGASMVASITVTAASWVAENVAMAAASTAAAIAENAATLGIGAAILLLVAGIVWVATHWKEVWGWIKDAAADARAWIKQHVELILAIFAPFLLPFYELVKHWGEIWDSIKNIAGAAWNGIVSFVKGGINVVIGFIDNWIWSTQAMINGVLSAASHIPGISSLLPSSISLPVIPKLATGGIAMSPTIAMIGEAGPEAVIPLDRLGGMGGGHQQQGFGTIQLVLDRQVIAEVTYDELLKLGRRNIKVGLA